MGDGVSETAVEQAQARGIKGRIHTCPVRTVGVQQQRLFAVFFEAFFVHNGNRDLNPIAGFNVNALRCVVVAIKAAQYLLLFELGQLFGIHVVIVRRGRGGQRHIAHAQDIGIEIRIHIHISHIGVFAKLDIVFLAAIPGPHAQLRNAFDAFGKHQVVFEYFHAFQQHVVAVRNDFRPVFFRRSGFGRCHQAEVFRIKVGAEVEFVAKMVHKILKTASAWLDDAEGAIGFVGIQHAVFGGQRLERGNNDVFFRLRFVNCRSKGFVRFVENLYIFGSRGAQFVLENFVRAQRSVFDGIKNGLIVVCPHGITGSIGDFVLQHFPRFQIFEKQGINATAEGIFAISQNFVVAADRPATHGIIFVGLGQFVDVQHDLFFRIEAAFFARMNRVFFARFVAGQVEVAIIFVWNRFVVLLDAAFDFFKQLVAKRFGVRRHLFAISILTVQISDHFRVLPFV